MSPRPSAHVLLRDRFHYTESQRVYFEDGTSNPLDPGDRAILECIQRGESEIDLLARKLTELEIGGEAGRVRERCLRSRANRARSSKSFHLWISWSPRLSSATSRSMDGALTSRGWCASCDDEGGCSGWASTHAHPDRPRPMSRSSGRACICRSSVGSATCSSCRSIARFHSEAVLVLCGPEDLSLFGDFCAVHRSLVALGPDWPLPTPLETLRGAGAMIRDPLESLRGLFFAMRFAGSDMEVLRFTGSSDLTALAGYGLAHASRVAYTRADQPEDLGSKGRQPSMLSPAFLGGDSRPGGPGSQRCVVVVGDAEHGAALAPLLQVCRQALDGLDSDLELIMKSGHHWMRVEVGQGLIGLSPRPSPVPRWSQVACVVLVPGVLRDLRAALEFLAADIPCLLVPSSRPHPLLDGAEETLLLRWQEPGELRRILATLSDGDSALRAEICGAVRRWTRDWDLGRQVSSLVSAGQ